MRRQTSQRTKDSILLYEFLVILELFTYEQSTVLYCTVLYCTVL